MHHTLVKRFSVGLAVLLLVAVAVFVIIVSR
jgi:hypothetical protein